MKGEKLTSQTGKPRRAKVDWKALEIVHPDAAGIDVGGMEHWVVFWMCGSLIGIMKSKRSRRALPITRP